MTDFTKIFDKETKIFHVQEDCEKTSFRISFMEEVKAHEWMLALRLGTVEVPEKSPESYRFMREEGGILYFQALKTLDIDNDWDPGSCCQSGCPGCPWTEANMAR